MHSNIFQKMNKKTFRIILIMGLLLAGIFIKIYYINYTETWQRQHDVIGFGADEGHAAYIEYILENRQLPDFDPREKWGFFQPPLHHIVSAFVIYVSEGLGMDEHSSQENTQVMTCFYMILLTFCSIYMFLKSKGVTKLVSDNSRNKLLTEGAVSLVAIVSLHPMFILLSGSINNDALALILSVLSLIVAASWYEKPGIFRTVLLAILIGLSMLAKLTGGLVAVPIGILMFMKFFGLSGGLTSDGRARVTVFDRISFFFRKYLVKAVVFAAVVFPVGLSFSIRNKIKWDVPLNYIPPVGEVFPESVTFKNRIFDVFSGSVYTILTTRGDAYDEYNVPSTLVKTSLFGEYSFADVSRWMKPLTLIVFASAIVLIAVALVATVYMIFSRKSKMNTKWKIIVAGTYFTYLAAYLYFAFSSNNFSAQDFRYSAICIVCEAIFTGLFVDTVKNTKFKNFVTAVAIIFAASSFLTYALLGFKS